MHIWDTKGMQLTVEGWHAPAADELISAEFSYGGGGTCQAGTVRPLGTYVQGRDTAWQFLLNGSPVFLGIPDNISDADGQLAQISLMAPHRPRLGGLGESLGSVQADPHETLSAALERTLGSSPAADIGIRPDGGEVAEVPWGGDTPDLAGLAYDVRYIGPSYPDAVTDAVFDPGEGWQKYAYRRYCPPFALRRTAAAKVLDGEKTIAEAEANVYIPPHPERASEFHADVNQSAVYNGFAPVVPEGYGRFESGLALNRYGSWTWNWAYPADTPEQRTQGVEITLSIDIASVEEQRQTFIFQKLDSAAPGPATITETQISRDDGTTIEMGLYLRGDDGKETAAGAPQVLLPRRSGSVGVFSVKFSVPEEFVGRTLYPKITLSQGQGHRVTMTILPPKIQARRLYPNTAAVQMPEGWEKPFATSPRYEFRLPGWHIPPFRAFGQQVASATVTWNANECSTLCTTGALSYG